MQCPRCKGFIVFQTYNDDDPKCSSCSRLYPQLKPIPIESNSNGAKTRRGLYDTIRYTGLLKSLKDTTCVLTFKPHPTRSVQYPLLEVSCPWCMKITEVKDSTTNPAAVGYRTRTKRYVSRKEITNETSEAKKYLNTYTRTGNSPVKCPTGHWFWLKITSEGVYSWE